MWRFIALAVGLAACSAGCSSDPHMDAGVDAGMRDAGPWDAGMDAGPPPTGCHLWTGDAGPEPAVLPSPGDFVPPVGPGGPSTTFEPDALGVPCAYLPVGPTDENHHNTGFFLDGYLVRPWAHERGRGGIAVWDLHEPCAPVLVANPLDDQIRETHATGLSNVGGRFIAVASLTGIQIWDVSDVTAPSKVIDFTLPGVVYPGPYERVVMSVFWQAPYLYVGGSDNGIYIVDASDPSAPVLVAQHVTSPAFRVGQLVAVGNQLFAFSSEGSITAILDISDPGAPRPIAGGDFRVPSGLLDRYGRPLPGTAYFGHVNGGRTYHARQALSGGLVVFDVSDPSAPGLAGVYDAPGASGGYVFLKEGTAFLGLSTHGVALDVTEPSTPVLRMTLDIEGDVDTLTPFGNVVVISVDDDAIPGQASAVIPFEAAVDTTPPEVNMVVPRDGAERLALSSRVGLTFTEFVEMSSVWRGSVILRETASGRVIEGHLSGQEGVVNFWPAGPLRPATEHEVIVPAGGVTDLNGNAITRAHRSTFTTVACDAP
jgi:hypothetical protein